MTDIFINVDAVFMVTVRLQAFLNTERTVKTVSLCIWNLTDSLRYEILLDNEIDPERQFLKTHFALSFLVRQVGCTHLV